MSGLAEIAHQLGASVSGSDVRLSPVTERLTRLGITVYEGHAAENLPAGLEVLIITSAVDPSNPELVEARRRGVPVLLRGELLAELMRTRLGAAVAGSHGKTTTSTMLASICIAARLDPTVVIGGSVPALDGANAKLGAGDLLVCESDESDGSFLWLMPRYAAITNVDHEHLDHYGTFEHVCDAFAAFANRVSWAGAVAVCVDDDEARRLLGRIRRRTITYGVSADARLRILRPAVSTSGVSFELERDGQSLGEFALPVLGEHNILNATAAIALALEIGVAVETIRAALAVFRGPGRRMERKGEVGGVTVIDDYGHHPSEIRATLKALRPAAAPGRLYVLFQPHRYTRTRDLIDEFTRSFKDASVLRVVELYAASEKPIEGVSAQALAERIREAGHADVKYAGSVGEAAAAALGEVRRGDTVLTLGAGSITQAADLIVRGLKEGRGLGQT
jgi:UDP-N-acetylmuramate--alanine ligase